MLEKADIGRYDCIILAVNHYIDGATGVIPVRADARLQYAKVARELLTVNPSLPHRDALLEKLKALPLSSL